VQDTIPQALRYRELAWRHLREEVFDVLVIGGGINGAGVARDAALRGMSVAVIERGDFACGTSSRSSKLIHGGVRYLEYGEVGLVLEACRERELLRSKLAPHLVRAQPFVFPIYEDDDMPVWQLRAGLTLYDMLAGIRNVQIHRALSRDELCRHEPMLSKHGLVGGALYYDCATDDARLTVETMVAARDCGATVLNYAEVVELEKDSAGRLAGARIRDRIDGRTTRARARCFINVTGPWIDRVRKLDDAGAPSRLRLTKGVHAVFDRSKIGNRDAVVIRGAGDHRIMFAIPWQDKTLVGTTDTYFDGDPAKVEADAADIDYILATVNSCFPDAGVTAKDVISTYAGLRPLVAPEDEMSESDISRDDQIFESPSGLLSLGGGKLTTYRNVAERLTNLAGKRIGRQVGRCRTAQVALPGAAGIVAGGVLDEPPESFEEHLRWRYGARGSEVAALSRDDDSLRQTIVGDLPDLAAEVAYAVDHEMALTLRDVLERRLQVHLRSRERSREVALKVADLMGSRLGWDEKRRDEEVARYVEAVAAAEAVLAESGDGGSDSDAGNARS
jgi:glycerol-3-phosphate dehydrogenase